MRNGIIGTEEDRKLPSRSDYADLSASPVKGVPSMQQHAFQVLLEWEPSEQVWVTYVPALNFLSDFGETREQALEHTREAIALYLESAAELSLPVTSETSAELVTLDVAVS